MSKTNLDQIPVVIRIVYLRDKLKLLVQLFKDTKHTKFSSKYFHVGALVRAGATDATAPLNFGQCVHAPINFQGCYSCTILCLLFPSFVQILHPSIEISKKVTVAYEIKNH